MNAQQLDTYQLKSLDGQFGKIHAANFDTTWNAGLVSSHFVEADFDAEVVSIIKDYDGSLRLLGEPFPEEGTYILVYE